MKFIADENISAIIIAVLREHGFDVKSVREQRRGFADEAILVFGVHEERIVITQDTDFGELTSRRKKASHGVILIKLQWMRRSARAERVLEAIQKHLNELKDALMVIEPGRVRIRRFEKAE